MRNAQNRKEGNHMKTSKMITVAVYRHSGRTAMFDVSEAEYINTPSTEALLRNNGMYPKTVKAVTFAMPIQTSKARIVKQVFD